MLFAALRDLNASTLNGSETSKFQVPVASWDETAKGFWAFDGFDRRRKHVDTWRELRRYSARFSMYFRGVLILILTEKRVALSYTGECPSIWNKRV
jgi:hypothetical protein